MPDIDVLLPDGRVQTYYNVESVSYDSAVEGRGAEVFISEHLIQNQMQVDWAQTDDTQPDYIKNKPFYEIESTEMLIEEISISTTILTPGVAMAAVYPSPIESLIEGDTYQLTLNNETYECVASVVDGDVVIGNIPNEEGAWPVEYPFIFGVVPWDIDGSKALILMVNSEENVEVRCSLSHRCTTVKKIDEKFLPEIDNVTSWNDLEDKPFYEYEGRLEILPITKFEDFYLSSYEGNDVIIFDDPTTYDLVVGETYIVHWDGEEYSCRAQDASTALDGAIALGNTTIAELPDSEDVPFTIGITRYGTTYFAIEDTEAGNDHDVGIFQDAILAHKIDRKFIPDVLPEVTTDDAGKILQVDDNGRWGPVAALPVVLTQAQYDELVTSGNVNHSVLYLIARDVS